MGLKIYTNCIRKNRKRSHQACVEISTVLVRYTQIDIHPVIIGTRLIFQITEACSALFVIKSHIKITTNILSSVINSFFSIDDFPISRASNLKSTFFRTKYTHKHRECDPMKHYGMWVWAVYLLLYFSFIINILRSTNVINLTNNFVCVFF